MELQKEDILKIVEFKKLLNLSIRDMAGEGASLSIVNKILPKSENQDAIESVSIKDKTFKALVDNLQAVYFSKKRTNDDELEPSNYAKANTLLLQLQNFDSDVDFILASPNGNISGRINYIKRDCDELLYSHRNESIIVIRGGIKSGKTALLKTFKRRLEQDHSNHVVYIDFNQFEKTLLKIEEFKSRQEPEHLFVFILHAFLGSLQKDRFDLIDVMNEYFSADKLDFDTLENVFINSLSSLYKEYISGKKLFFLFDDLAKIERSLWRKYKQNILDLFFFFDEHIDEKPWKNIKFVTTLLLDDTSAASSSHLITQCYNLDISFFNTNQIQILAKIYGIELTNEETTMIHIFFAGQPYLVHLFIDGLALGTNTVKEALDMDFLSNRTYQMYINSLSKNFSFLLDKYDLTRKKGEILEAIRSRDFNKNRYDSDFMFEFMETHIINENGEPKNKFIDLVLELNRI